jgi:hypothetical protein
MSDQKTRHLRLSIVVALPVIVLLTDFWMYPALYETHVSQQDASLTAILAQHRVLLGRFKQHRLLVSIDDIQDPAFLGYLNKRPTALLVSGFAEKDMDRDSVRFGELQRSVLAKLKSVSQSDSIALTESFFGIVGSSEGQVLDLPLHIPVDRYARFPVDHVMTMSLRIFRPNLSMGFSSAVTVAQHARIANLVVPSLAIKWPASGYGDLKDMGPRHLYDEFFQGITPSRWPENIYLSIYGRWPTYQLEDVVQALNAAWHKSVENLDFATSLYRPDFRLTVFFLEVCLISCSFFLTWSLKNAAIVITSYVGLSLGIGKWVDFVIQTDPDLKLILKLSILAVLAVGFPFVINWNPKDLFDGKTS